MRFYQVDAFTDSPFSGNPAAVCISDRWLSEDIMQKVAIENNLSETAFAVGGDGEYRLRWFTPGGEVDLCGHATLATAFVIMTYAEPALDCVGFETASGRLEVRRDGEEFVMDFPLIRTHPYPVTDVLRRAVGSEIVDASIGYRDPIVLLKTPEEVRDLKPDMAAVEALPDGLGLFVTAPGYSGYDFVSRAFWPKIRIPEDPVCGSMHCSLADFWMKRTGKTVMVGRQVSARGGTVGVKVHGERVEITGRAALFAVFEVGDGVLEI